MIRILRSVLQLFLFSVFLLTEQSISAQNHSILLGRPTDVSVTASIQFDYAAECYLEYGTVPASYTATIPTFTNTPSVPDEVEMHNLMPDTRYYYRMRYRPFGIGTFSATPEYTFHTQRAPGNGFTFTVEADEHLYDKKGCANLFRVTLGNQLSDQPDFMLSLGDIFGDDHSPDSTTLADMDSLHEAYRPFLGEACHSIPFYVCLGNHEGESDFHLNTTPPYNIGVYGTLTRKKYYPNPYPDNFYTGDTIAEGFGMDLPENYYSWTWGDALFVVLDVYRTQCADTLVEKPTGWNWTLGEQQYFWLYNTLQNSSAPYKFVFAHHIRGQGRGGIADAPYFEWGGYQNLGGNYTFPNRRPGWPMSIHEMFVNYGVNIFFQGHDHVFAHEQLDGVTYQTVPMAADSTYEIGMLANAGAFTADTLDGSGHLRVDVSPSCVQVDYVRAYLPADTNALRQNGSVAFSYTIGNCATGISAEAQQERLSVFPNPATDRVNIKRPKGLNGSEISLTDLQGSTLLTTTSDHIDLHDIPAGVYLLAIYSDQHVYHQKLIVRHQ